MALLSSNPKLPGFQLQYITKCPDRQVALCATEQLRLSAPDSRLHLMTEQNALQELLRNIASRIKERRKAMGLSQEGLAEKAGVSTNYLARLELGSKQPTLQMLLRLSNALAVGVADLLEEPADEWSELAQEMASSLRFLSRTDADYAIEQFRATIKHHQPTGRRDAQRK